MKGNISRLDLLELYPFSHSHLLAKGFPARVHTDMLTNRTERALGRMLAAATWLALNYRVLLMTLLFYLGKCWFGQAKLCRAVPCRIVLCRDVCHGTLADGVCRHSTGMMSLTFPTCAV
ncbi:hypothetical protein ElyMa_004374700 [Elysia marginata]|uniref:Uncharacterized protein n=1 Tax=Elysia marginata TaxID=1093978 RepID=A0AAV4H4W5_9GAST|nr:hypothetical protein ElyMa_004374700 [Elysia marginata]